MDVPVEKPTLFSGRCYMILKVSVNVSSEPYILKGSQYVSVVGTYLRTHFLCPRNYEAVVSIFQRARPSPLLHPRVHFCCFFAGVNLGVKG